MVASSAFKAEAAEEYNVATKHKHKLANKCTHIHTYKPKVKMPIESFQYITENVLKPIYTLAAQLQQL